MNGGKGKRRRICNQSNSNVSKEHPEVESEGGKRGGIADVLGKAVSGTEGVKEKQVVSREQDKKDVTVNEGRAIRESKAMEVLKCQYKAFVLDMGLYWTNQWRNVR